MKTLRLEPLRKEEFTKDQWFEICRRSEPGLTRQKFEKKWPAFCRYLTYLQNHAEIEIQLQ